MVGKAMVQVFEIILYGRKGDMVQVFEIILYGRKDAVCDLIILA